MDKNKNYETDFLGELYKTITDYNKSIENNLALFKNIKIFFAKQGNNDVCEHICKVEREGSELVNLFKSLEVSILNLIDRSNKNPTEAGFKQEVKKVTKKIKDNYDKIEKISKDFEEITKKEKNNYLPTISSKIVNEVSDFAGKTVKRNTAANVLALSSREANIIISGYEKTLNSFKVSTCKLLDRGIIEFARLNHTGKSVDKRIDEYVVTFNLKEYALDCKVDIIERATNSPEAAEKEKQRIKNNMHNFRRKIKEDLEILRKTNLSWQETIKGKAQDFANVALIGSTGITNGYITIAFDPIFAKYLIQLPLTQYNRAVFGIDDRNPNAYKLARKINLHYNNDNNLIRGTAQTLKVKTLLNATELPSIEEVRKEGKSWNERIKTPFEDNLNILIQEGVLENWEYRENGNIIEKNTEFSSFEEWSEKTIFYILKDAPDMTARLERREKEKAENKKLKNTKNTKNSSKKKNLKQ